MAFSVLADFVMRPSGGIPQLFSTSKDSQAFLEVFLDMCLLMVPIWLAIATGLVLGWSWKPRWVSLLVVALRSRPRLAWSLPPGLGARRLWLAATAAAAAPAVRIAWSRLQDWLKEHRRKLQPGGASAGALAGGWPAEEPCGVLVPSAGPQEGQLAAQQHTGARALAEGLTVAVPLDAELVDEQREDEMDPELVTEQDLWELRQRLDERDGGPPWAILMEKRCPRMEYVAWRRDPEVGPTQYRTQTRIEACTPELMRDFYWDDDFRRESQWDDLLTHAATLEEWPRTGVQVVQWVRRFPFFCKDREYVIARRIWAQGDTFFCITKGVRHARCPPRDSPRRVDLFYSSWRIAPLPDGSCEVVLFHHEDMGLPRHVAKLGIRQGMWGAVKKIEPGVRRYQAGRQAQEPLSRSASMASINTPVGAPPPFFAAEENDGGARATGAPRYARSSSDLQVYGQRRGTEEPLASRQLSLQRPLSGFPRVPSILESAAGEGRSAAEAEDGGAAEEGDSQTGHAGGGAMLALGAGADRPGGKLARGGRRRKGVGWMVAGSVVAVAVGLDKGLLAKIIIAGMARKVIAGLGGRA